MWTNADHRFMLRALELARRGLGFVEPNPMVGCVIVKNGRIVGEGFHGRFGGPHAEIEALAKSGPRARGADFYVTLEPCCYQGKTPPCTQALLRAGAARVIAATLDPNPRVAGGGLAELREAGVKTAAGLLQTEADALIAPFAKWIRQHRPWVIAKWAQSLDGRIATRTGDSKWISDATARAHAHATRGRVDAIIVGINTVLSDDPLLTCRDAECRRVARRVILDQTLRTPPSAQLVRTARRTPTWIFHSAAAPAIKIRSLQRAGCILKKVTAGPSGLRPAAVLRALAADGASQVLVEGGGEVLGRWLDARVIDEIHCYVAPVLIGGRAAVPALGGKGSSTVAKAMRLPAGTQMKPLGDGWLLEARPLLTPRVARLQSCNVAG